MDLCQTIFALSSAYGPTGHETEAIQAAGKLLRPLVSQVYQDKAGSLVGLLPCGKPGAKTLLLDAHLDEVSMMVTGQEEGFLTFAALGIDARVLPGQEVVVCTQPPMPGVVTCLPPHILTEAQRKQAFALKSLRIDCGLAPEQSVAVGTPVVYGTKPFMMGQKVVCGKALDNRCCFALLLRALELLQDKPLPVDVYVLGSVQEEFSGLGAAAGAFALAPDSAIVVDVTFGGTPDSPERDTFPLGSGPAVGLGPTVNRGISQRLLDLGKEKQIPVNREILPGSTGTNSMHTQISREGIPSACLSVPLRYMHTPIEAVHLDDVENGARLLAEYILSLREVPEC